MSADAPPVVVQAGRAAAVAEQALARLATRLGEVPLPVPIEDVAASVGLRVTLCEEGLVGSLVRNHHGRPISGLLDFRTGRIYVDARESAARCRFTIAHEVAHELLGHEQQLGEQPHAVWSHTEDAPEPNASCVPPIAAGTGLLARLEREADECAGNLLVPAQALERAVAEIGPSVALLAARFGVSASAMRRHLKPWLPELRDLG